MEIWIAIRGAYADERVVGVAASEEEAKQLVREAYWNDYPDLDRSMDPMNDWDTGDVEGPFKLGKLRKGY